MSKKKSTILEYQTIADCIFGNGIKLIQPYNLYGCSIGDNSFVGPFVEIQSGVKIGKNTRISSHSFICTGVQIGDNCFIGHGVMFVNDKFKGSGNNEQTVIGDNVKIGSNVTILPVTIGNNVIIGAGSVVTSDVPDNVTIIGNPGRPIENN